MALACRRTRLSTGSRIAISSAMMASTTSNSISVKPAEMMIDEGLLIIAF
jgi:hypothetical protein